MPERLKKPSLPEAPHIVIGGIIDRAVDTLGDIAQDIIEIPRGLVKKAGSGVSQVLDVPATAAKDVAENPPLPTEE